MKIGLKINTDRKGGKLLWTELCPSIMYQYVKAVYCHPVYLTYMESTSCEMPAG